MSKTPSERVKEWRKLHPNYNTDWMRNKRANNPEYQKREIAVQAERRRLARLAKKKKK